MFSPRNTQPPPDPDIEGWFLARVTGSAGSGGYAFAEVHLTSSGGSPALTDKASGLFGDALSKGYPVDGSALAAGQIVLARAGNGAPGNIYELLPLAAGASAALYGLAQLPAPFDLSTGAMEDIGLSVTIPAAGTYLVTAHVFAQVQVTWVDEAGGGTSGGVMAEINSGGLNESIANAYAAWSGVKGALVEGTGTIVAAGTYAAGAPVKVRARRDSVPPVTWDLSRVTGARLAYARLG